MSEPNPVVGIQPTEHCGLCPDCCTEPVQETCYQRDGTAESSFLCPSGHTWIVKWLLHPDAGEVSDA